MADRYWVGGTANWDGTAGTKWAATSGGTGGASVPTSADDVFFDANSGTGTVTIATGNTGAKSINCTGFTGTITGSAAISVAGSITLSAGMTYTHTGVVTITGTGTLTTAGKSFSSVTINGAGITVTLGDALDLQNRNINVSQGTFNTANYNLTTTSSLSCPATGVRVLNFGSSTITVGDISITTPATLTLNAGTSQINLTLASAALPSDRTYYNVSFTSPDAGTRVITGSNTFNNLSVTAPSSAGVAQVSISGNQTINGTLSTTGTAGNRRVWFRSDTYGVRRTLTVNSAPSLSDADFRDIIVTGTAAPISGTRIGNRGACAGITFSTPKTVYWNLAGSQNWSDNAWAATSGGTPSVDNFPLSQDTAVFNNAGSASIVSLTNINASMALPSVDMSARTTAITINFQQNQTCYGSWTNGSGTAFGGGATLIFEGQGTKTITSAGKTFLQSITIDCYGGTVELADALNIGSNNLTVTNGTFDSKSYNITANTLSSDNSNVRTIKLGSSTVTLGSSFSCSSTINLTFNAGTSQINLTGTSSGVNVGSGLTFYNVSYTNIGAGTRTLSSGGNTFNNLSISPLSTTGMVQFAIGGNQTVTGTLTVAGSSATQRAFLRSDTIGTPRTLTVGTLSANDCDFRDITIAGAAAGTAPTRAGDCGGNSGITFPAPKTVYWNLAGSQNWTATAWATSSGGTPAVNNFPLAQDTAVFDNTGAAGTVAINANLNIGTLDASARTSAMTLNHLFNGGFHGNYTLGSGVTVSGTATQDFLGRGTMTFTSAGKTLTFAITVNTPTGTLLLGDAFNSNSSSANTLSLGTFDAVSYNVTVNSFIISGSGVRTLRMGSGLWTLSGTGGIWNASTTTNLTFLKGTADILLSDTSTSARTFNGGGLSYNKLTIGGTTGTSTTTITGDNQFTELASTKTVAHTIALGTTTQTFGKWSVTGSAGNVVTLTGTGTSHVLAGSATSGIDYLAMGSIGFAAAGGSLGEFYAGANSTGTAGAPVFRTATPAPRTLYWVGGTGNWTDTTKWSLSSGGAGGQAIPTSLDNVIFDSASNATAYTTTIDQAFRVNSLTISGPASGNVTLAGSSPLICHGNVTLPATGLTRTYTGTITLSGSTTGKTFTTNGVTLASAITVNGVGCEWTLGSALNTGTSTLTVTNGTFITGNYNVTAGALFSNNFNSRTVNLGSSTISLSALTNTLVFISDNLSFNAGTSQINLSASDPNFAGAGQTFNNVSFTNTSIATAAIGGVNTFNNLTVAGRTTAGISNLSISANQTINGTLTLSAGTDATCRTFVQSNTLGTARTLTCNAVSATDVDFRDITIAGSAAPVSGTRLGNCDGNSGITFAAPKTVYRVGTATDWSSANSWATTSGGTGVTNNFPLAQDTAVIDNNTALTGTLAFTVTTFNIGSIDCSNRTTGITINHNGNFGIYGNYTLGSGVTVSGTANQNFFGRRTMTLSSSGKTLTFAIVIQAPNGTLQLGDAFTSTSAVATNLVTGTFSTASYNVTVNLFASSNSLTRTLNMGSGLWTLTGTGTVWNTGTITNLTLNKGSADIRLSDNSSSSRTFAGGGLSYNKLTIAGNTGPAGTTISGDNTFTELASTKTVAHSIALGTTTQRLGALTANNGTNTLTITGNTSNLIYTGSGSVTGLDYLNIQGRAYGPNGELTGIWNAGANSTNSGSLGWVFAAAPTPPASNSNFFLLFA